MGDRERSKNYPPHIYDTLYISITYLNGAGFENCPQPYILVVCRISLDTSPAKSVVVSVLYLKPPKKMVLFNFIVKN